MSYRAILHSTGGMKVGLWRPRSSDGPVALLLGRGPENWYGSDPSGQARALVDKGYWVVAVDTPNWGNQTDMDSIDAALAWIASAWGRDTGRIVVVAHNSGCVVALNWGMRHDEWVASMTLEAPIIDLAERHGRGVDVSSLEAAYGGSTANFNAAMPTWNPAHLHRKIMVRDLLGDRLTIYYSTSDSQTPPAVTTALATDFTANTQTMSNTDPTLVTPAPVVADAVARDVAWGQQASAVEQRRWTTLVEHPTFNYRGGDMTDSVELADGRVIWIGSDIFAGGISADGTLNGVLPFRNAIFIQDAAGDFDSRVYESGSSGVAFSPDSGVYDPSWIYWAIACMREGTTLHIGCWIVGPEGVYGYLRDSHIVSFDTTDFSLISRVPMNITTDKFFIDGFVTDGAYTYIYGEQFDPRYGPFSPAYGTPPSDPQGVTRKYVARVSVGSVTNVGAYQFWDGSGWSTEADAVPMVDDADNVIEGDAGVYRVGSGSFILGARTLRETNLRVYQSTTPYGPWTQYATIPTPSVSDQRYGGNAIGQIGKFVPHVSTPAGTIQYSICPNILGATDPVADMAYITFRTRFVTVPLPS